jgi:hypothetical protein
VYDVLIWQASGMTIMEILVDYPELSEKDIQFCIAYTAYREHRTRVAYMKPFFDQNISFRVIKKLDTVLLGFNQFRNSGLQDRNHTHMSHIHAINCVNPSKFEYIRNRLRMHKRYQQY